MLRLSRMLKCGIISKNTINVINCRSLYSASTLGVDGYIGQREKIIQQFSTDVDQFRSKMSQFIDQKTMIMTEDLKNVVYLANNEKDFELLEKMIHQFNKQEKQIRFGNFIFGPVVMRLLYHTTNSDLALKFFKDPAMDGFFDQLISYQILVDMLYEEGRYKDVIDVYQMIRSRQLQGGMYPKYVIVLVFAACCKENTPESYKFACELWAELIRNGHNPLRRAALFSSMLAVKQNAPHVAMEILGTVPKQGYVTVRNIKVLALAELGRSDDALPILRSVLEINEPTMVKHTFSKDVIARLKEKVHESGNSELIQKYNKIEQILIENGHISDETLNDLLTKQINVSKQNNSFGKNEAVLSSSYSKNHRNNQYEKYGNTYSNRYGRPGLTDID